MKLEIRSQTHTKRLNVTSKCAPSEWSNPITNDFIWLLLFLLNCDYIVCTTRTEWIWPNARRYQAGTHGTTHVVGNDFPFVCTVAHQFTQKWKEFIKRVQCARGKEGLAEIAFVFYMFLAPISFVPMTNGRYNEQRHGNNNNNKKQWQWAQERQQMCSRASLRHESRISKMCSTIAV